MTSHPNHLQDSGAVKLSVRRIGDGQTVIGPTEAVMEFLGLSPQHNEHCKGWRWHMYMQDTHKRAEAVREQARKIIAARRAVENAAELLNAAE